MEEMRRQDLILYLQGVARVLEATKPPFQELEPSSSQNLYR